MTSSYTIEKVGNEYVVKVDDQKVITVGNRRKATRLVAQASGMLEQATPTQEVPVDRREPGSKMRSPVSRRKPA